MRAGPVQPTPVCAGASALALELWGPGRDWEKNHLGLEQLFAAGSLPCSGSNKSSSQPSSTDPSTADSTQRDVKGAGTWHRTPARADVTPNVQAELFYCFLHRPLPPGEAKTSSHRGNELGYSRRRAASSAFPTGNTSSCAQLCPADPPKPIPPSWGSTEGGEKRTEGGEKTLLAQQLKLLLLDHLKPGMTPEVFFFCCCFSGRN